METIKEKIKELERAGKLKMGQEVTLEIAGDIAENVIYQGLVDENKIKIQALKNPGGTYDFPLYHVLKIIPI